MVDRYLKSTYCENNEVVVDALADAFQSTYTAAADISDGYDEPLYRQGRRSRQVRSMRDYLPTQEDIREYGFALIGSPARETLHLPHEGTMAEYYLEAFIDEYLDDDWSN